MKHNSGLSLRVREVLAVLFCAGLMGSESLGVPLAPGGSVPIAGTNYAAVVVEDVDRVVSLFPDSCPVAVCDPIAGLVVRDRVTRLATGTYNFERFLRATIEPGVSAVQFSQSGFGGFATDVDFDPTTAGGASSPATAERDAVPGNVVTFRDFVPATLASGAQTDFMTIKTDATAYALTGTITVHVELGASGFHGSVQGFAPAVPEPSSAIWIGLGGMGLLRRRCGGR